MSADRVDEETVAALLMEKENIDFVVNIPKAAYVVGNTFALAEERNFGFGGLGDLFAALRFESPRTYVNREFEFRAPKPSAAQYSFASHTVGRPPTTRATKAFRPR